MNTVKTMIKNDWVGWPIPDPPCAIQLIDLLAAIRYKPDLLIITQEGNYEWHHFAKIQLALDFEKLGKGVMFRAIMEEWDQQRIVKETY